MDQVHTARTRGDGMENDSTNNNTNVELPSTTQQKLNFNLDNLNEILLKPKLMINPPQPNTSIPGEHSIYRGFDTTNQSLPPVLPKGKIFHLIPKLVKTNDTHLSILKNKEPKFIPFEPYKGAVNPLVPYRKLNKIKINKKNNLDLNVLVSQMSDMKTNEMKDNKQIYLKRTDNDQLNKQLIDLKSERDYYESQLKFQVQVNSELKNLLVAAVGEDLQTKVNVLTEDKLQLARALLNSAQNLSSHTEQIEYLAGQSEVWRSKFLASSLMVEELARWKASLLQKNSLLLQSNKEMLETLSKLREMEIEMLRDLKFLSPVKELNLPSSNVLDLTAECLNIVQQLILHSGIGIPSDLDLSNLDSSTNAEKLAVEALQNSNQPLMSTDEAFRAIVGQAFSCIKMSQPNDNSNNITNNNVST